MPPATNLDRSNGIRRSSEMIAQYGRGYGRGRRSMHHPTFASGNCLCDRSHCHLLCHVCGWLGWGRLRYSCSQHPLTIFLIDMVECPSCKAYWFMMSEF